MSVKFINYKGIKIELNPIISNNKLDISNLNCESLISCENTEKWTILDLSVNSFTTSRIQQNLQN